MQKLRLELDKLAVESFDTSDPERDNGTVVGHASFFCTRNVNNTCGQDTCDDNYTCGYKSCGLCGTYKCTGGESCYNACDPEWTMNGYDSCAPNASCGQSCDTTCETQIC